MSLGNSDRTLATAARASSTAFEISVPICSSTNVVDDPVRSVVSVDLTPSIEASAPSILVATWFSSSRGAAPGIPTLTMKAGNEISGLELIGSLKNEPIPIIVRTMNKTTGMIGFLIAQDEILRMVFTSVLWRNGWSGWCRWRY